MIRSGALYVNLKKVESIDEEWSQDNHVMKDLFTVVRIGQ